MIPVFVKVAIIATVVAIATTGVIVGIIVAVVPSASNDNECLDLVSPHNVIIEPQENHVVIYWSPSTTSDCDLTYTLEVKMNDETRYTTYNTTNTFLTISKTPRVCSLVEVYISVAEKPITTTGYIRHLVTPTKANVDDAIIKEASFDPARGYLKWIMEPDFAGCTLSYEITANEHVEIADIFPNAHYFFMGHLYKLCQNNVVKLKPIVQGIIGIDIDVSHEINVPPKEDVIDAIATEFEIEYDQTEETWKWTDYIAKFDTCTVAYRLTINSQVIVPDLQINAHSFTDRQVTEICKGNSIILNPIVEGVIGKDIDLSNIVEIPPTQDAVDAIATEFKIEYDETEKTWKWTDYKTKFDECTVAYRLTINSKVIVPDLQINAHSFTDPQLTEICKGNSIILNPIVAGVVGKDIDLSTIVEVPPKQDVIDAIATEFKIEYDETEKTWKWTDYKAKFDGCTVAYRLTINSQVIAPNLQNNAHSFTDPEATELCKGNSITLNPIVAGVVGEDIDLSTIVEVPPKQDAIDAIATEFKIEYDETEKTWKWTDYKAKFDGCTVAYRLTINSQVIAPNLQNNAHSFTNPEATELCKGNSITLNPIVAGVVGEDIDLSTTVEVPPQQDAIDAIATEFKIEYDETEKTWKWTDYKAKFDGCTVAYRLTINSQVITPNLQNNAHSFTDPEATELCKGNSITLNPIVAGVVGEDIDLSTTVEVPPQQDAIDAIATEFKIEYDETEKTWKWTDYKAKFDGCTVAYRLTINSQVITPNLQNNAHSFTDPEATELCKGNSITLNPIVAGVVGEDIDLSTTVEVPPQQDAIDAIATEFKIEYDETEKTWKWTDYKAKFDGCTVAYRLTINSQVITPNLQNNAHSFTDPEATELCKGNSITLNPIVAGVVGEDIDLSTTVEVPPQQDAIDAIATEFKIEYDETEKTWKWTDYKAKFDGCTVAYRLTINSQVITPNLQNNAHSFTDPEATELCKGNSITLNPIVAGVVGEDIDLSTTVEVPPQQDAIDAIATEFKIEYDETEKTWKWTDYKAKFDGCTVAYRLTINSQVITPNLQNNAHSFTDPEATELCKGNSITLNPIVAGVVGEDIDLSTTVEVPPQQDAIDAIATEFKIEYDETEKTWKWTDYKAKFDGCTVAYRLTINSQVITPNLQNNAHSFTDPEATELCKGNSITLNPIVAGVVGQDIDLSTIVEVPPKQDAIDAIAAEFNIEYDETEETWKWTDYKAKFDGCTVAYRLTINSQVITPNLQNNAHSFTDPEATELCKGNSITLNPIVAGVVGQDIDLSTIVEVPPKQDAIDAIAAEFNIEYDETKETWIWTDYKAKFDGCTVAYRLTINSQVITPNLQNNAHSFTDPEATELCKGNSITLNPIVAGVVGEDIDLSTTVEVPPKQDAIDAIATEFKIEYDETEKTWKWTDYKAKFDGCTVAYRLTINSQVIAPDLQNNAHSFTDPEATELCKGNSITLNPIVAGVVGEDIDLSTIVEVPPQQDVIDAIATEFKIEYDETEKTWKWTDYKAKFDGCTVAYRLTINSQVITPNLQNNAHSFTDPEATELCKGNSITLNPIVAGVVGEGIDLSTIVEVPPQQDAIDAIATEFKIEYDETEKTWKWTDYKAKFDGCTVAYRLTINSQVIAPDLQNNAHSFTDPEATELCKGNSITLNPIVAGVVGEGIDLSSIVEVPPQQDAIDAIATEFKIEYDETEKTWKWTDYKAKFDGCTVAYRLTINSQVIAPDLQNNAHSFTDPEATELCKGNSITLNPIVAGVVGEGIDLSTIVEVPPQQDAIDAIATEFKIEYDETEKTWKWTDYKAKFDGCTVAYRLTINSQPIDSDLQINAYKFTNEELTEPCNGNVIILIPVVAGVIGKDIDLSNNVEEIPKIEDGKFIFVAEDDITVSWTAPIGLDLENCDLKYDLKLRKTDALDSELLASEDNFYQDPLVWIPTVNGIQECGDMKVTITPKYNSKLGTSVVLDCTPDLNLNIIV